MAGNCWLGAIGIHFKMMESFSSSQLGWWVQLLTHYHGSSGFSARVNKRPIRAEPLRHTGQLAGNSINNKAVNLADAAGLFRSSLEIHIRACGKRSSEDGARLVVLNVYSMIIHTHIWTHTQKQTHKHMVCCLQLVKLSTLTYSVHEKHRHTPPCISIFVRAFKCIMY